MARRFDSQTDYCINLTDAQRQCLYGYYICDEPVPDIAPSTSSLRCVNSNNDFQITWYPNFGYGSSVPTLGNTLRVANDVAKGDPTKLPLITLFPYNSNLWHIILDKDQTFSYGGTAYSLGSWSYQTWQFYLGNVNSTSTPTGANIRVLISELILAKSMNEPWYFNIGSIHSTGSNRITGAQTAVE